ncbi:hypothetical protein NR218_09040 [Staphylococcus sp. SUC_1.2]|uniref:hypothetical protein n=1 Tax=Staphylococcus sp. SUC_1.2 TaxID=2969256 RepID=UPI0022473701|nr:hypothetical protein [Staphylococcus sp. SUC_1.2]MCW9141170.1 hypothetical protein [Staphylococcus sp. SUC_1.2]
MKSKIKINITGQKEYLYSTRQITQIIDIISEKHYKNEIINEIANSDKIKNIIILSESTKINQKYKDINENEFEIDSNSLLDIYHKGKPISLIIDKNIMLMNKTFELFENLYQHNNQRNIKMTLGDKEALLFELYKFILDEDYLKVQKFFKSHSSYSKEKINSIIKSIKKTINLYKRVKTYEKLEKENKINENKNEEDNYQDVKKIKNEFLQNFSRLSKPILYIQLDNKVNDNSNLKNEWQMLGIKMIKEEYFKHSNPKFLDINKIEQNSPLYIELAVSIQFIPILIKLSKSLRNSKEKDKSQEDDLRSLDEIIEMMEKTYTNPDLTLNEINENEKELDEKIKKLPNKLKSKVYEMRNGLTEGNISSLKENKIHLTGIEINEEENEIKDDIENEIKNDNENNKKNFDR